MTEYSKKVFSDPKLLREKLAIYLEAPEKVEIYADACEKFFQKGARVALGFTPTWSWWGLFFTWTFFLYRKNYSAAIASFVLTFVFAPAAWIGAAIAGKYMVAKRFAETLDLENDEALRNLGGRHTMVARILGALQLLGWLIVLLILALAPVAVPNIAEKEADYMAIAGAQKEVAFFISDLGAYYVSQGELADKISKMTTVRIENESKNSDGSLSGDLISGGKNCLKITVVPRKDKTPVTLKASAGKDAKTGICREVMQDHVVKEMTGKGHAIGLVGGLIF